MNAIRTSLLSFCAVATLAFAAPAQAGALSYVLPMNTDPVAESWILQNSGGSHSVSGGILTISSPVFRQFKAPDALWNDTVSNANGWQVGARLRLTTPGESPNSRVQLWLRDDVNFNRLEVFQDRVELQSGFSTQTYFMDTTDFHAYEVVAQGMNTKLFVDNIERISIDWVTSAGATFAMNFGDGHGDYASTSEWDYVTIRHNGVPAPGSAAIMALAGAGLARRRR